MAPKKKQVQKPEPEPMSWPTLEAILSTPDLPDPGIVAKLEDPEQYGGVVEAANWIVERLKQTGMAVDVKMSPSQLGLHPSNRGSYGCHEEIDRFIASHVCFITAKKLC